VGVDPWWRGSCTLLFSCISVASLLLLFTCRFLFSFQFLPLLSPLLIEQLRVVVIVWLCGSIPHLYGHLCFLLTLIESPSKVLLRMVVRSVVVASPLWDGGLLSFSQVGLLNVFIEMPSRVCRLLEAWNKQSIIDMLHVQSAMYSFCRFFYKPISSSRSMCTRLAPQL
jgi:hypothetical protein